MAITYIEVDTALLKADVEELETNTANARKSLESLAAELEELNTMWSGRANMAFRKQANSDCAAMENMLREMDKLAECMKHAGKEYENCENNVKSAVDGIRI